VRGHNIFQNASIEIHKGDFLFLMAPSGAGKSTFIRLLLGLDTLNQGNILIGGRNLLQLDRKQIPILRRRMGVVLQDPKLLPHRTVFENVALPLEISGREETTIRKKVHHILGELGLDHKINTCGHQLSGGEQYRVAIARAVVNDPVLLLVDEPTGNLEEDALAEAMSLFEDLRVQGTTVVIASHMVSLPGLVPESRVVAIHDGKILERTLVSNATCWV